METEPSNHSNAEPVVGSHLPVAPSSQPTRIETDRLVSVAPPPLDPALAKPPSPPAPWGFWATAGLALGAGGIIIAFQALGLLAYWWLTRSAEHPWPTPQLESNGLVLGAMTILSVPLVLALCWWFVRLRGGLAPRDYLGLRRVPPEEWGRWLVRLLVLLVISDGLTTLLGRPIVPDVMVAAYQTAGVVALLWMAVVVAAPISEEVFFRGFMFRGFAHSWLGGAGASVLTSLCWSAVHLQYDLYGMGLIFVAGLLLGWARWRTGSILPGVMMHAVMNSIATLQVMIQVHYVTGK